MLLSVLEGAACWGSDPPAPWRKHVVSELCFPEDWVGAGRGAILPFLQVGPPGARCPPAGGRGRTSRKPLGALRCWLVCDEPTPGIHTVGLNEARIRGSRWFRDESGSGRTPATEDWAGVGRQGQKGSLESGGQAEDAEPRFSAPGGADGERRSARQR